MVYVYRVQFQDYYILRLDESVKAARAWAKRAFPRLNPSVSRDTALMAFCGDCDSYPCVCREIE
jgi:hypothetical protein